MVRGQNQKTEERNQDESISIQRLQRAVTVPQCGNGGKGVGRVALQWLEQNTSGGGN